MNDLMQTLFNMGQDAEECLVPACHEYCHVFAGAKSVLTAMDRLDILKPMASAVRAVHKFTRCVSHLFVANWPDPLEPTTPADVVHFLHYRGPDQFAKRVRALLQRSDSFWQEASQEVLRCGSQSVLLSPKVDRLRVLLVDPDDVSDGWPDVAEMQEAQQLLSEVSTKLRAGEVQPFLKSIRAHVLRATQKVLACAPNEVPAGMVDMLVQAMSQKPFGQEPGFESIFNDLQGWLSKNRSAVALADLIHLMEAGNSQNLKYDAALALLPKISTAGGAVQFTDPDVRIAEMYLLSICEFLHEKAMGCILCCKGDFCGLQVFAVRHPFHTDPSSTLSLITLAKTLANPEHRWAFS